MYMGNRLTRTGPTILSLIGLAFFAGIWIVYLFSVQPEGSIISGVIEQFKYSLDPSEDHFSYFAATIISFVLCSIYSIMFWCRKSSKVAMILVGLNTALALTFYSWSTALIVAAPLIYILFVNRNA